MRALLRLQESPEGSDDDDDGDDRAKFAAPYRATTTNLHLRCSACAGSGCLWVLDQQLPRGRPIRCVVCRGKGRIKLRRMR